MRTAKLHLLLLALVITGIALVSLSKPASAIFCWHVSPDVVCCERLNGQVICSGG